MEIERKFLVKKIEDIDLLQYPAKHIVQDYLYSDLLTAIRKRAITENNKTIYTYTIKTGKKAFSVNEIENEITKEQYDKISLNQLNTQIVKTRYLIPYLNNLIIELDVFEGEFQGLIFAEIEFESEEQAYNTVLPNWFDKELSNSLTNNMMATNNRAYIDKIIDSI